MGDLVSVVEALGGRLDLELRWHGEGVDRLVDERHTALVDGIVRLLRRSGWETEVEVSFSIFGERGSIDVVGYHPGTGRLAVIEAKATIGEANQTVMRLDCKGRLAPQIAAERGWPCHGVARFLVIADGSTARDRVARHAGTFGAAFPMRNRECLAWLREPVERPPSGLFFLAIRDARTTGTNRPLPRTRRPGAPPRL